MTLAYRLSIMLMTVLLGWPVVDGRAAPPQPSSLKEVLAALGKGPELGPADAPVTIVEFSDFQCGYCKKFATATLPKLKEVYLDKGTARLVFRHFAILGKRSEQAALAAECAAEQGKFWQYHDKLFANLGVTGFSESRLKSYARDLRLNERSFASCLSSAKYKAKVERETVTAAYLGGRGTPMFLVNHWLLIGAQPFETFQQVIDKELSSVAAKDQAR